MFPFEKHVNIYVVPLQLFYYVQKNIPVMNSVSDWKTRHLKRNRSIYYYQSSWKCGSNLFIIVNLFVEKRKKKNKNKNKKKRPGEMSKTFFFRWKFEEMVNEFIYSFELVAMLRAVWHNCQLSIALFDLHIAADSISQISNIQMSFSCFFLSPHPHFLRRLYSD